METNDKRRATRHGFWFGIFVGGLLGALVAGAVVSVATVSASPVLAAKAFGHGFGRAGLQDPEAARGRAEFAASFILERVDATEEQQAEVKRIVSETIGDLVPPADEHRANRDALHSEFSQVVIDAEEIERIRLAEMVLAEEASRELTEAFTAFAQTLTAEQRNELMEMAERFHRR